MRLFVAIDIGEEATSAVAKLIERLRTLAPKAKWVAPENLHLTLAFLGEVDDALVQAVGQRVDELSRRHPPLRLTLGGLGLFGRPRRPRVLWVGISGEVDLLTAVNDELARTLLPLGYVPEKRPFSPHLTLARARGMGGDEALAACAREPSLLGPSLADSLVLYRSDLSPKGPTHTPLLRAKLRG